MCSICGVRCSFVVHIFQFFMVIGTFLASINGQPSQNIERINYRLPNNTKPNSYDITLATNIDKNDFSFTGRVAIKLVVVETSYNITIHARQLTIKTMKLSTQSGAAINLSPFTYDKITEFLVIPTNARLQKGLQYLLIVEYSGVLRIDRKGFYRASYVNAQGETKWLAATEFEPTEARHAFPCYDEPAFKAIYTIHIEHDESQHAISNTKETRRAAVNGRVRTDFKPTPLMSTYLVAFVISDYVNRTYDATVDFPTTHRIFASDSGISHTSYALNEAVAILKALENYLQVQYVLPKLDQVVVPKHSTGAMENWGLVTYPDHRLLFDPTADVAMRQLNVSNAIAHEFSHQWFGNLVTPVWWSQLWLSEGMATVFRTVAADMVHSNWHYFDHFLTTELQPAFRLDAQANSHPMTYYVEDPHEIESIFDDISYSKAGAVIRMFMFVIGEGTFKKALNYYLTNNLFRAVDEDNLFEALDTAIAEDKVLPSDFTMKKLFGSWSNQKGFPVLKITRNYKDGSVRLHQQKYDAIYKPNEPVDPTMWWIPYNFASASNAIVYTTPTGWLSNVEREKILEPSNSTVKWTNTDWLLFNIQQTGYYRVWYDDENYKLLSAELNDGDLNKIHPMNRAQILDDLHDFVYSGRISAKVLCDTITYLRRETLNIPWETARKMIKEWNRSLQTSSKLPIFQKIIVESVQPFYQRNTLKKIDRNDEIIDHLTRNIAVTLACEFGVSECLKDSYAMFQEYLRGTKFLPNIRGLIIANGIRSATNDEIARLWEIFLKCSFVEERKEIISSFGNIPSESTLHLYLSKSMEHAFDGKISVSERLSFVFSIIDNNQHSISFIINFISQNLVTVNSEIGSVLDIFKLIAERILTTEMQTQFYQLLNHAKEQNLIKDKDIEQLECTVTEKINWQTERLNQFEMEFFTGKCNYYVCPNNGASLVPRSIATSVVLYIIRWFIS